jgi:hypothetical protein
MFVDEGANAVLESVMFFTVLRLKENRVAFYTEYLFVTLSAFGLSHVLFHALYKAAGGLAARRWTFQTPSRVTLDSETILVYFIKLLLICQ